MNETLYEKLKANTELLEETIRNFPEARILERPATGAWNFLEVIEHLVTVERNIPKLLQFPSFSQVVEEKRYGAEKMEQIFMDRTEKWEAPDMVKPKGRYNTKQEAADFFSHTRKDFLQVIYENRIVWDSSVRPHPRLGPVTNEDWVYFVIHHAARHRQQILDLLK